MPSSLCSRRPISPSSEDATNEPRRLGQAAIKTKIWLPVRERAKNQVSYEGRRTCRSLSDLNIGPKRRRNSRQDDGSRHTKEVGRPLPASKLSDRPTGISKVPKRSTAVAAKRISSLADPLECGICLDDSVTVEVGGCAHRLCMACARQLCKGDSAVPPSCPFCRVTIGTFLMCAPC